MWHDLRFDLGRNVVEQQAHRLQVFVGPLGVANQSLESFRKVDIFRCFLGLSFGQAEVLEQDDQLLAHVGCAR